MSNEKYKILSIDGGGIMGIIPGQILTRIEEHFRCPITYRCGLS